MISKNFCVAVLQGLPALEINRPLLRRRTNKQEAEAGLVAPIGLEFFAIAEVDRALELRVQVFEFLLLSRFGSTENYCSLTHFKQVLLEIVTLGLKEAFVNIVT